MLVNKQARLTGVRNIMIFESEPLDIVVRAVALSAIAVCWVVLVVRVVGLRAFRK